LFDSANRLLTQGGLHRAELSVRPRRCGGSLAPVAVRARLLLEG
jgi:hypothetical protein